PPSTCSSNGWKGCCMSSSTLLPYSGFTRLAAVAPTLGRFERAGAVSTAVGLTIEVAGLNCAVGEQVLVETTAACGRVPCQVVGFRSDRAILMPFGNAAGIVAGG